MGAHENASGISSSWKPDKKDPGVKYAGRYLYHQPGECVLAGGLLQTDMAIRHGSCG